MTRGRFNHKDEPLIEVTLLGKRRRAIEAVIDTGFSGDLCLSSRFRRSLQLVRYGSSEFELADGTRVVEPVYGARILFDGKQVAVLVTLTSSEDSLVGTGLLEDKELRLNFRKRTVNLRHG